MGGASCQTPMRHAVDAERILCSSAFCALLIHITPVHRTASYEMLKQWRP